MNALSPHHGFVRRIDALLRYRFPLLVTTIYEVKQNRFEIVFDSEIQDAAVIATEFDESIRFMTVDVELSNNKPKEYIRTIPNLSDAQAHGKMEGLPLRRIDLLNLVQSRFSNINIVSVEDKPSTRKITVIVRDKLDRITQSRILNFLNDFALPASVDIEVHSDYEEPSASSAVVNPLFVWASRLRPLAPPYVIQDEAFWFDNIEDISLNRFPLKQFPGLQQEDAFRCYLDLTVGEAHINLRQALLCYDEIWCSPPLAESHEDFFRAQALSEHDLLAMVDAGRLKFLTTQPEERLQIRFLERVYEHNHEAILGRRTTAALLVADVASVAESSLLNDSGIFAAMGVVTDELSSVLCVKQEDLLRSFLWPMASRRGSLHGLIDSGSKGGPALDLAKSVAALVKSRTGVDLELEALVLSEAVHLGHALGGTILGPLEEPNSYHLLREIIGRHLNFHKHFNQASVRVWAENETRRISGPRILPAIPMFEFDPKIPIEEFLDDTRLGSTRKKGRCLYARLAALPLESRQKEIDVLESKLRTIVRRKTGAMVDLDAIDASVTTGSILLDFVFPPLTSLCRLSGSVIQKLRKKQKVDDMMMSLEDALVRFGRSQELDFLSRVNRVATFRRERV